MNDNTNLNELIRQISYVKDKFKYISVIYNDY